MYLWRQSAIAIACQWCCCLSILVIQFNNRNNNNNSINCEQVNRFTCAILVGGASCISIYPVLNAASDQDYYFVISCAITSFSGNAITLSIAQLFVVAHTELWMSLCPCSVDCVGECGVWVLVSMCVWVCVCVACTGMPCGQQQQQLIQQHVAKCHQA